MLKVDQSELKNMEEKHLGIPEQIWIFENAQLPACPNCKSTDTADVQVGITGRTTNIAAATTKFKLIPNGPKPGVYFCNNCERYFGSNEQIL